MAFRFSGTFEVKRKPEEVYDFLTDPNKFAARFPDSKDLVIEDSTHFTVKVNVGIAFIKASGEVRFELAEANRPCRAQYRGEGVVAGGNVTVVAGFDLVPVSAEGAALSGPDGVLGTKVNWQGEAEIGGRLAALAGDMLEPMGKKQINKLIEALRAELA